MTLNRTAPLARTPFAPGASSTIPPGQPPARRTELARTPWARTAITAMPVPGAKSAATKKREKATGNLIPDPPSEFTPKVKHLVRKRAGNGDPFDALCESCGAWLGAGAGEFQHRAARGAGGCKDEVINSAANCAFLCSDCHRRAESRDPRMGIKWAGFWLEHGTTPAYDPRNVPILLASPHGSGIKVHLATDGLGPDGTGYLLQRPELAAAS